MSDANEVAQRWEVLKRNEKGRESVTDGIAWQLPALILYTKLLRKAALVDVRHESGSVATNGLDAMRALRWSDTAPMTRSRPRTSTSVGAT